MAYFYFHAHGTHEVIISYGSIRFSALCTHNYIYKFDVLYVQLIQVNSITTFCNSYILLICMALAVGSGTIIIKQYYFSTCNIFILQSCTYFLT